MRNLSPPPTHVLDVSDPIWVRWFSLLYANLDELESPGGGGGGTTLPSGGTAGQMLIKTGTGPNDLRWADQPEMPIGLPTGGTKGQVLIKQSSLPYDALWDDPEVVSSRVIDGSDASLSRPQIGVYDGGTAMEYIPNLTVDGGRA